MAEPGPNTPAYYLVKWITWKEKKTPIITQSQNGPCPLLAIMNTLFLRWKVQHCPLLPPASSSLPPTGHSLDSNALPQHCVCVCVRLSCRPRRRWSPLRTS